jgi:hypothetical protein
MGSNWDKLDVEYFAGLIMRSVLRCFLVDP